MPADSADPCTVCDARSSCAFAELPPEARAAFGAMARKRFYGAGSTVLSQGDPADTLYVVQAGLLRIVHLTADGKPVGIHLVGPAKIVGLAEVLAGSDHSATVEAVQDSRLELVARRRFLPYLEATPALAVKLLVRLSRELERVRDGSFASDGKRPLGERLLGKLQELAGACGVPTREGLLLDAPLTVQDLAGCLGCSRQWASKLLSDHEERGLVERRGRRILLTPAGLERED